MRATAQDPVHKLAQCLIDAIPTSSGSLDDPNVLGALKHTIQQLPAKYYPERLLQTSNLSEKQLVSKWPFTFLLIHPLVLFSKWFKKSTR